MPSFITSSHAVKRLWLLCAHNEVNKPSLYYTFDLNIFFQAQKTNLSLSAPNFRPEQHTWPALLGCDIVTGMLSKKILQSFPVKSLLGKSSWTASQDISVRLQPFPHEPQNKSNKTWAAHWAFSGLWVETLTLTGFDIGRAFVPTLFSMCVFSKEKVNAPALSAEMAVKMQIVSTEDDDLCLTYVSSSVSVFAAS